VSGWARRIAAEGVAALRYPGRAGRKPRLDGEQCRRIEAQLKLGPGALGYESGLWTLPRVADLIER